MVKINDITSKSPTIKILCDQITFNASDETVVISDAVLDDCSNYLLPSLTVSYTHLTLPTILLV